MKKEVKIAGAGPAGLSAAINLVKAGYKVTVYERNSDVGFKSNGDFQGLENWTKDSDVLQDFKKMNINPTFKHTPMKKFEMYDYKSRKYLLKSKKPVCYIISRGNAKGTLDYSLKQQALKAGVKIIFKKELPESRADIVATGAARHIAVGEGIKFKIINREPIGCGINFEISESAIKNKRLYVGEAAGFQDYLFGFGIKYAVTSGYLAAKSIIDKKNYDALWKDEFEALLKQGISNRLRYEHGGNERYVSILQDAEKTDALDFFAKWYRPNLFKAILYPFAKALYKDRKIFK